MTYEHGTNRMTAFSWPLAMAFALSIAPIAQADEVFTARFSHVHPPGATSKAIAAEFFAAELQERTDGRIQVEVYPSAELFGDQQAIQALQGNSIQFLAPSTALLTTIAPELGVLDLPFLLEEDQVLSDVIVPDSEIWDLIHNNENLSSRNIGVLGLWDYGHKHIWTNTETRSYSDLAGQQLRVVGGSDPLRYMMESWDINPTAMSLGEVYNGIQQGVVDGFDNGYISAASLSIYEVTDYVVMTNHGYNTFAFLVNEEFMSSLPDDLRATVLEVAAETTALNAKIFAEKDAEARDHIKQEGSTEFIAFPDEDIQKMRDAAVPQVWNQVRGTIGDSVIDELLSMKKTQ